MDDEEPQPSNIPLYVSIFIGIALIPLLAYYSKCNYKK